MKAKNNAKLTRRDFLKTSAVAAASLSVLPSLYRCSSPTRLATRDFGLLNHEVTTFGLGGQASIQWTPDDVDPVAIILKAFDRGVNYFDSSNLYGPSQNNYGMAFRKLGLTPGLAGYNESLRRSIFLTSKTHLRYAKGESSEGGPRNWSNGTPGSHTVDDLKRSLSQLFGDGQGNYPDAAYLDMMLLHSVSNQADVDAVFEGLDDPDPKAERIGALVALRDYRDGTNFSGLNPKEERLIKHIGFSGHHNAAVMMDMIQRDTDNLLEGMLVAINANDKQNFNMQNNVIPVAAAKNMGIIAMKVFADGAMYTKPARWSRTPEDVVRTVGSSETSFKHLVKYTLTTPGISTAIMGIGQISDDPVHCQLEQDINAAQVAMDGLSETDRSEVENMAKQVKMGKTNYFQVERGGLTAPYNIRGKRVAEASVELAWDTAYAGSALIDRYLVVKNGEQLGEVLHQPQTTKMPFTFREEHWDATAEYKLVTVDKKGMRAESEMLQLVV